MNRPAQQARVPPNPRNAPVGPAQQRNNLALQQQQQRGAQSRPAPQQKGQHNAGLADLTEEQKGEMTEAVSFKDD
jgi:hypothetical protein